MIKLIYEKTMDMDHDSMCIQFYFDGIYLNASNIKKQDAKIVEKEEKKSFTFVVSEITYIIIHNICVKNKMNTIILILIMK